EKAETRREGAGNRGDERPPIERRDRPRGGSHQIGRIDRSSARWHLDEESSRPERGEEKRNAEGGSPSQERQDFTSPERNPEGLEPHEGREVKPRPSGDPEACRSECGEMLGLERAKARHERERHTRRANPKEGERHDERSEMVPVRQGEESDRGDLVKEKPARQNRQSGQ